MPEPDEGPRQVSRRDLLGVAGLTLPGAAGVAACQDERGRTRFIPDSGSGAWGDVRRQFALRRDRVHMSAMLITSHPAPVCEAITRHRRGLDADPARYLEAHNSRLTRATLAAAGRYLDLEPEQVALTDSTTAGVGLIYGSLSLRPGQEILTTDQDYFVTHEAVRLACRRTGAVERRVPLFADIRSVSVGEITGRLVQAISPATRVLGLTWVHSSTGLKLPLAEIGEAVAELNRRRDEGTEVLIVVDGVHGFGNQDTDFPKLGCDFLAAGCHKWLFGPRGTGVVAGSRRGYDALAPSIPSFLDDGVWDAWIGDGQAPARVDGRTLTPGGFKAFEHVWALAEAFGFHQEIGKRRIAERTAELASQLKTGLARTRGVILQTPISPDLSAGIVSFDVEGRDPQAAANALRERGIVASVAPYAIRHVRLTPCIRNTPQEVDRALEAVAAIAA